MPGGFPTGRELTQGFNVGSVTSTSRGTHLSAPSAQNAKGPWTQLVAATPYDACFGVFTIRMQEPSTGSIAVDIGFGPSGQEQTLIANLVCEALQANINASGTGVNMSVALPLRIPAGTRIAARFQTSMSSYTTSGLADAAAVLFDGGFFEGEGYVGVDACGFNSSATLGAAITPSGTSNTKGSYTQLTAATARDYAGIFAVFDNQNSNTSGADYLFDIAVGPSGQEQIIVPNIPVSNTLGMYSPRLDPIWMPIQAGSRLAARVQGSGAFAMGLILYGIYQ